jgi:hypothetical protein
MKIIERLLLCGVLAVLGLGCDSGLWPEESDHDASPVSRYQFWKDCGDKPVCECGPACAGKPVQITTGMTHSCLRYDTGGVLCWGALRGVETDPSAYIWNNGSWISPNETRRPAARSPEGIDDAIAIASGHFHVCALRKDHTLWCWGRNNRGQLGLDDEIQDQEHKLPVQVPGLDNVTAVCAGNGGTNGSQANDRSFALAGRIYWGQPGSAIACGEGNSFACYITPARTLLCWGENTSGQLGDGTGDHANYTGYAIPAEVLSDVVKVDGAHQHACALRQNGELWCWGRNFSGALGLGAVTDGIEPPRRVIGLGPVIDFSTAGNESCAIEEGGQLYCWGGDRNNLLGADGDTPTPQPIAGEAHTRAVSLSVNHGCLIRENDEVACWGDSSDGATAPYAPMEDLQTIKELPRPGVPADAGVRE